MTVNFTVNIHDVISFSSCSKEKKKKKLQLAIKYLWVKKL